MVLQKPDYWISTLHQLCYQYRYCTKSQEHFASPFQGKSSHCYIHHIQSINTLLSSPRSLDVCGWSTISDLSQSNWIFTTLITQLETTTYNYSFVTLKFLCLSFLLYVLHSLRWFLPQKFILLKSICNPIIINLLHWNVFHAFPPNDNKN